MQMRSPLLVLLPHPGNKPDRSCTAAIA